MKKAIIIGLALMSIVLLTGCITDYNRQYCESIGYDDYRLENPGTISDGDIYCYTHVEYSRYVTLDEVNAYRQAQTEPTCASNCKLEK